MASLGELFLNTLPAANLVSDLILVSPIPYTGFTPLASDGEELIWKKILFQIIAEEEISIQSEITDHYVETNVSMQDHIALKPRTFRVSGYVGELNNVPPDEILPLKLIADKLQVLGAYTPSITATALRAYNTTERLYNVASKAVKAYKKATGVIVPTKQLEVFKDLMDNWKARTLFNVHTPWGTFTNAAILNMRMTQGENDANSSDFEVVFKEVKTAETLITDKKVSPKMRKGTPVNKGGV